MKLKHILLTGVVAGLFFNLLISCNTKKPYQEIPLVDYVSTLVGSQSDFSFSNGNTYPAVALPWGMNFWTPQTGKMGNGWTYMYTAKKIVGLKQTHQPSPWINDYGQFSIMPIIGTSKVSEEERASYFSHKAEVARPYYYSVYLADYDITAELAPTDRSAIFRFTYPKCDSSSVLIDAFDKGSYVCVQPELQRIIGYTTKNSGGVPDNFRNYFVVEFDKPFHSMAVYRDEKAVDCLQGEGNHMMALVSFATEKGEQVSVTAASSFISQDQALVNLQEIQSRSFDKVKEDAKTIWNETLGRIHVEGGSLDQYRTFYSCLYRCLLFPRKFFEVAADGSIYHYSPYNGQVCEGYLFTDTGFWDTFRALFPLLNLVYPSVNTLIQEGLVNIARESDFLPEWASPGHRDCMIGNNSASVVADAAVKEIGQHDLELLYHTLQYGYQDIFRLFDERTISQSHD
jgi:predicted alpha-1,2-mannosidase